MSLYYDRCALKPLYRCVACTACPHCRERSWKRCSARVTLRYICPDTTSYYYIYVLILLYIWKSYSARVTLLYICPDASVYLASSHHYVCCMHSLLSLPLYGSSYYYTCALNPLCMCGSCTACSHCHYMCTHTTMCALNPLCMCVSCTACSALTAAKGPARGAARASYYYIYVLILL